MHDKERNPWQTRSSSIVYSNPWITVREDQVLRPDGTPGIYGVVDCRVATGIVALNEKLEIYLVGQYRYPTNQYSWEIIEGGAEHTESPLDAAKRELKEEAGLRAKNWIQLGNVFHLSNCHSSEKGLLYLATELTQEEATPEVTEVLQIKTVSFKEALHMVESGYITDALTIVGLYRAERFLQQHTEL